MKWLGLCCLPFTRILEILTCCLLSDFPGWGFAIGTEFQMHSWRLFIFVCLFPALAALVGVVFMPESPRFLLEVRSRLKLPWLKYSLCRSALAHLNWAMVQRRLKTVTKTHWKYGLLHGLSVNSKYLAVIGLKSGAVIAHRSNILLLCKHSERPPRRHQDSTGLPSGHCYTFNHTRSRICMLQRSRSNISHTPTGRTHFSIWQEGARRLRLATVRMGTKSLRCSAELKHLRGFSFFSSECPTRRGVDGPAASPRHQLEGQGRAGESLHRNYSFTQRHMCNQRLWSSDVVNIHRHNTHKSGSTDIHRGEQCSSVPLSDTCKWLISVLESG